MSGLNLIHFLHVMLGVTLLGVAVASFFYVTYSWRHGAYPMRFTFKASFFGDALILPIIIFQFFSGYHLMIVNQLSLHTPWILIAFIALSTISVLWLAIAYIRYINYQASGRQHQPLTFHYKKIYNTLNLLIIILLLVINHDAIMQQTWFNLNFLR